MEKRTKIIATIGPASDSVECLTKMFKAGMNVARLNFSHGSYEYFTEVIKRIRQVSEEIAIMLDTKGPEIRTGVVAEPIELEAGDEFTLTNNDNECTRDCVTVNYPSIHKIEIGHKLLIDDGMLAAEVISKDEKGLRAKMLTSGTLNSRKTVTVQGHNVELEFLSEQDRNDIMFGIEQGVDLIAASFVREPKDVVQIQQLLDEQKSTIKIISKIEHWRAVDNYREILRESLGIMVARGDLGVELPMEKVPRIQGRIIRECNEYGKPVIVATQMLESMRDNPRPTRAEVSDIAQAIRQGADCVMLSGETTTGKYPVEAVKMMAKIAKEYDVRIYRKIADSAKSPDEPRKQIALFVTKAAYHASRSLKTAAIITPTATGYTTRKVARFRPHCRLIAVVEDMTIFRQLQVTWGVSAMVKEGSYDHPSEMVFDLIKRVHEDGLMELDDRVVVTAGFKQKQGYTNLLEIYRVRDVVENLV